MSVCIKNEDISINFQAITKYSDHVATHTRYQIFKNNYPIEGAQIILHENQIKLFLQLEIYNFIIPESIYKLYHLVRH